MPETRDAGRPRRARSRSLQVALILLAAAAAGPARAGEETINAFAPWVGRGGTFQTGPADMTFVGSLVGRLYAETDKGPIAWGRIVCPGMIKIAEDGAQKGTGSCTIVANDGARIYAELTCAGSFMAGCDGELKITAGTERFAKVTGQGPVVVRSDQRTITVQSEVTSSDESTGILVLRGFKYKTP
jgi:hypothetical protein